MPAFLSPIRLFRAQLIVLRWFCWILWHVAHPWTTALLLLRLTGILGADAMVCARELNPRVLQEIVGPLRNLLNSRAQAPHLHSEWTAIESWFWSFRVWDLAVLVAVSFCPPAGVFMAMLARFRSIPGGAAGTDYFQHNAINKELWLQVNGLGTTEALQYENCAHLADIVHRQVHGIHNPTMGLAVDLCECIFGRTLNITLGIDRLVASHIRKYAAQHRDWKIILVCHSPGAIITANALKVLVHEGFEGLGRLEVYTFGCAVDTADSFPQVPVAGRMVPLYEHFANTRDVISRIGVLSWDRRLAGVGDVFVSEVEGHLFGEHYLRPLLKRQFRNRDQLGVAPRFMRYVTAAHN
eukprot:TRINITY_DN11592_c0_g1_i1.p1 TRINITY_DN11592_c0_g1~~TRINITY_DN11592_c0_g1_i1.p1  ORF type:complete len:353 (-),score=43.37 TRINITY_DN11592_c0_g1_i1:79-1137(-)